MTTLEELGLLKMDFLGLRTLTVIDHAVKMIEHDTGVKLDMEHLDYNDEKSAGFALHRQDGRRVPAGKRRDEKLHEGAKAPEP